MPDVAFPLGQLTATPGALALGVDLLPYLRRHSRGDWGDVGADDWAANARALETDERLFSAYETPRGCLWIITEADRSATTVLRPEDY